MKYVIIIPDGCADEPQDALDGKTPLQSANIPAMDAVAARGIVGASNNTPKHLPAGSAVANLSLLGYDPNEYFTGRAPLEAAAQGIELAADDWAIRCNLVCVQDQTMKSFTAGHISSEEASALLKDLQAEVDDHLQFMPGVSYRNLLVFRGGQASAPFSMDTRCTPPHDLTDKTVLDDYPRGPGCDLLESIMATSQEVFANHPVNQARIAAGKLPATNVWLWGCGKAPKLPPFEERFGKTGAMITAVDLLRGIAKLLKWNVIEVPGATGYTDTDYAAKGRYAIDNLDQTDVICVHVEATDEASHEGDAAKKIEALQEIDAKIVAPICEALTSTPHRVLVSPDHPTYLRTKTHTHGDVPFAMAGEGIVADDATTYDEIAAAASSHHFPHGSELMKFFLEGSVGTGGTVTEK